MFVFVFVIGELTDCWQVFGHKPLLTIPDGRRAYMNLKHDLDEIPLYDDDEEIETGLHTIWTKYLFMMQDLPTPSAPAITMRTRRG